MPELHDLLERQAAGYEPPTDLRARVNERKRQRARNRRVGTAVAALTALAIVVGGLTRVLPPTRDVLFDQSPKPWVGTWQSIDLDGSAQTMDISAVQDGYAVVIADDAATVCSGAPSTTTGTGRFEEAGLVLAAPRLTCADDSEPALVDGGPVDEALRDYTLVRDAEANTLTDSLGVAWHRPSTTPAPVMSEADASSGFWPQSTLNEVHEAQERADAGDPAYTWQVSPQLDNGELPRDVAIITRFLTQELGWTGYRCCAEASHAESMSWGGSENSVEVDFIRCADAEPNPLYPDDPEGRRCAPTEDAHAYETVRVAGYQPLETGPGGIWVIRSSRPQPSFRQLAPPSDADIANVVEPFLQARVDGQGARPLVNTDPATIPLIYTTSDGAAYERFEYEVTEGPTWPYGIVGLNLRLFADGGTTVVEQPFLLEHGILDYAPRDKTTTENGAPVPEAYTSLDGRVTFSADQSWEDVIFGPGGPDTRAFDRGTEHEQLFAVVGDPLAPAGSCAVGDTPPPSADALVRSIRSSPDLSVSAPKTTRVGAIDAVQLDIKLRDGGPICQTSSDAYQGGEGPAVVAPRKDPDHPRPPTWWAVGPDTRARLYAFDVPGKPARTVAILFMAPKDAFAGVITDAQRIVESFTLATE
jgi:hypothetical protein